MITKIEMFKNENNNINLLYHYDDLFHSSRLVVTKLLDKINNKDKVWAIQHLQDSNDDTKLTAMFIMNNFKLTTLNLYA